LQNETIFLKQPIAKNGISHKQSDELDLIHLIQNAILFIRRFRFILFGCIIAGLSLGLFFYISSPKQYSTKLIVHPSFVSNQDQIEIINNWKDLLKKGGKEQLASIMNCGTAVIDKLKKIEAEEILKTYVSNNPNGFLIHVSVTDTSVLDELQNGIIYGLNNSPFIKEKIAVRKAKNIELISTVNNEITKLNTTKNLIDSMIRARAGNAPSLLVDISQINAEWVELNEKVLGYKEDLKFLSGVQVLEDFHKGRMTRQGLLKFSFLGLAAGCFIGYVLSLFIYIFQKLKSATAQTVIAG
jgi:hypothetical protein